MMCRCCKLCWEEFIWSCFEEKFCYDESIATYNSEEDDDLTGKYMGANIINQIPITNRSLMVNNAICEQPSLNVANLSSHIHEEDYRRETNTNVPILGPEILAVFANSQIFQDNQSTKLKRVTTKPNLLQSNYTEDKAASRLIKYLEGNKHISNEDDEETKPKKAEGSEKTKRDCNLNRQILFDKTPCNSSMPQKPTHNTNVSNLDKEVILSPRTVDMNNRDNLLPMENKTTSTTSHVLRSAKSVPYIFQQSNACEMDFFAITGSGNSISMTPEVPAISYTNLPKNYDDTPTIEKYRAVQSLHSIQTANNARANEIDYSMPRYFRHVNLVSCSDLMTPFSRINATKSALQDNKLSSEKGKTNRLKMIRNTLPPLLLQPEFFEKTREKDKQIN